MTVRADAASNMSVERPAGSHSLAAAAHCRRQAARSPARALSGKEPAPGGQTHATDRNVRLVTADGYFAALDGNLDWVVPDEAQARAAAASISGFDTALFGRGMLSSMTRERFRTLTGLDDGRRSMGPWRLR